MRKIAPSREEVWARKKAGVRLRAAITSRAQPPCGGLPRLTSSAMASSVHRREEVKQGEIQAAQEDAPDCACREG